MHDDNEQTPEVSRPAGGGPVEHTVGRPVPERAGFLAQIEACRREVAAWPAHMRVVAVLRLHPAAMDGSAP